MPGVIDHANIGLKFDLLQLSALDLGTADFAVLQDWSIRLSNGIGAGQASQLWTDTRTLAGSASDSLDLAGSLVNAFGVVCTFTKIKVFAVRAAATNNVANPVQVLRGAANGVPIFLANGAGRGLGPGGIDVIYDPTGIVVTPGTGDLVSITNGGPTNPVSYDILILGTD